MKLGRRILTALFVMSLCAPSVFAASGGSATVGGEMTHSVSAMGSSTQGERKDYGEEVDFSVVNDNVKVTIEKIKTDTIITRMLIAIESGDGTPLKGDVNMENIDFAFKEVAQEETTEVNDENSKEIAEYVSGGGSWGPISDITENPYKVYYKFETYGNEPVGKDFVLEIGELTQEKPAEYSCTLNFYDYLTAHPEVEAMPQPVDEEEVAFWEKYKEKDPEGYAWYLERQAEEPKNILKPIELNLEIAKEKPGYEIDNIGLIDGKLHILVNATGEDHFRLCATTKDGEVIHGNMSGEGKNDENGKRIGYTQYYIWDITSLEDLKDLQITVEGNEIIDKVEEPFVIKGSLETLKDIKVPQKIATTAVINLQEDMKLKIKNMEISDMGLYVTMEKVNKDEKDISIHDLNTTLKMKDGSIVEISEYNASFNETIAEIMYTMPSVNFEDIQSVVMQGQEFIIKK